MRLAFISDIHEDLKHLKKILKRIDRKGYDKLICLGDISGFSPAYYNYPKTRNAPACLDLIRESCDIIIPGNHDLHAAGLIPTLPPDARYEYWPHEEDLDPGYSEEELAFLASLPKYLVLPTPDYNILLSHYLEPNLSGLTKGFYTSGKDFGAHFQLMQKLNCKIGFTGHVHASGFHLTRPDRFKLYGFRRLRLKDFPVVIGNPPVTRNNMRSGFCIFDTDSFLLQVTKLY